MTLPCGGTLTGMESRPGLGPVGLGSSLSALKKDPGEMGETGSAEGGGGGKQPCW